MINKGFAKYLANQIYQGKLDEGSVLVTYPEYKDDIKQFLDEMNMIPIFDEDENDYEK